MVEYCEIFKMGFSKILDIQRRLKTRSQAPARYKLNLADTPGIWGDLYIEIKLQGRIIDGQATKAFADLLYSTHSPLSSVM